MRLVAPSLLALGLLACTAVPEQVQQDFSWELSVDEMQDALLGNCEHAGQLHAVGGLFGSAAMYKWTSRRWTAEGTSLQGKRLWACWAGAGEQIIAVGQDTIFRHTAEGWRQDLVPEEVQGATLYGVWGMDDGTAVAVGGGLPEPTAEAVVLHFDGSSWTRADASFINTKILRGVWGTSTDNYWAVGDDGAIAHFDGEQWLPSPSHIPDRISAVYGVSPTEVYAVGGSGRGITLRWNGSSWLHFDESPSALLSLWVAPERQLFVAGYSGYVARYDRRGQRLDATTLTTSTTAIFEHLRINSLVGLGSAVVGAASTEETIEGDWQGAVVAHGRSFHGPVFENTRPDASVPDAGVSDAGIPDAD